ncbi:hypothetical protein R1sor_021308 [Riccia sorocarpa]|uniref:Uncharacterized protein n=1 Tax=Riccia sorocarpa TaxID=122646 RepID=A0ABD3GJM1_9MARC
MEHSELIENAGPPVEESNEYAVHSPGDVNISLPVFGDEMTDNMMQDGGEETCMHLLEDATLPIGSEVDEKAPDPDQSQAELCGDVVPESEADSDDEMDEKDEPTTPVEEHDLAVERSNLLARLKVVEAMLQQVALEEKLRIQREASLGKTGVKNRNSYAGSPLGEDVSEKKRQRRPNPKYFDSDMEVEYQLPAGFATLRRASHREDACASPNTPDSEGFKDFESPPNLVDVSTAPPDYLNPIRPPMIQRARTAVAKKHRVFSLSDREGPTAVTLTPDSNLDNLSIRELHDAYRKAFGKDTSVKDKHWLKRQIFIGLSKRNGEGVYHRSRGRPSSRVANLKARMEKNPTAEMPNGKRKSKASDGRKEIKRANRKALSVGGISDPSSPEPPADGECSEEASEIGGQNHGQLQESLISQKRVRKPNRKYFEDEGDESLGFAANLDRSVLGNFSGAGNGLRSDLVRLAWKDDGEVAFTERKSGASVNKSLRASARSSASSARRGRQGSTGMKRRIDGRAAKLAKLAESARAARLDAQKTVRKVKFRLPAAPGQEKGDAESGEDGEEVSCLLPILADHGIGDDDLIDSQFQSRLDESDDQAVVTVPTANGGTRRKHHRPWTLREVLTLVEGVARCGGGKWADIKKLAFSSVSYRTAVDLKDKWRNLLRASRAQLHPPKQGETRRKQFSAAIPSQLLARVRELAALNNQTVPNISGTGTSRSGRIVRRR